METGKLASILEKVKKEYIELKKENPLNLPSHLPDNVQLQCLLQSRGEIKKPLVEFVKDCPELNDMNGKMINTGGSGSGMTIGNISNSLILSSSKHGSTQTVQNLQKYLFLDYNPVNLVLSICGIEVDKIFRLDDDTNLSPSSDIPESDMREHILNDLNDRHVSFSASFFTRKLVPKTALVRKISIKPKFINSGSSLPPFNENRKLYDICNLLTLIGNCSPFPVWRWSILENWIPFAGSLGGVASGSVQDIAPKRYYKITLDDLNYFREIYKNYILLSDTVSKHLNVPLQRLNYSKRRGNNIDKTIELGVALESIFLHKCSDRDQLSYRFRLHGALFLGNSKHKRLEIFNFLKGFYRLRSDAVHSGGLKKRKSENHKEMIDKAIRLCQQSIIKIINMGKFPDWDELTLGTD